MKRGYTIIELMVSMGIFTVIATLAIGAFVTVSRMKSLTMSMRETQQKVRIATETVSRLAKMANTVKVSSTNEWVELYFDSTQSGSRFEIAMDPNNRKTLYYWDRCAAFTTYPNCTNWSNADKNDMLQDIIEIDTTSIYFDKIFSHGKPELLINLPGKAILIPDNSYYTNAIDVSTAVILESLK